MRVGFNHQYDTFVRDLNRAEGNWYDAQRKVTTGKRIEAMSDDPLGATKSLSMRGLLSGLEQYVKNLDTAKTNLSYAEDSLGEAQKLMRRANEIAIAGANGSTDQSGREGMIAELTQIQKRLAELGNTRGASGQFIFAGQKTDVKPFTESGSSLVYNGDSNNIVAEVSPNETMVVNVQGEKLFTDAYNRLESLKNNLQSGNPGMISGVDLPNIQASEKALGLERGNVGARLKNIGDFKAMHVRRMDELTANISDVEDVDMSEAIVMYKQAETAYQAALQSVSLSTRLSLMDFIQ